MSELADKIAAAASAGRLTHLSVVMVNGKWRGSYHDPKTGTSFGDADDPVKALMMAMAGVKASKVVKPTDIPGVIEQPTVDADPDPLAF